MSTPSSIQRPLCRTRCAGSRVANRVLGRTGLPFWQDESYDHWIRSSDELQEIIVYVENNPVKAGLAEAAEHWPWSSARFRSGRRGADFSLPRGFSPARSLTID
jgi:hypothetical protein